MLSFVHISNYWFLIQPPMKLCPGRALQRFSARRVVIYPCPWIEYKNITNYSSEMQILLKHLTLSRLRVLFPKKKLNCLNPVSKLLFSGWGRSLEQRNFGKVETTALVFVTLEWTRVLVDAVQSWVGSWEWWLTLLSQHSEAKAGDCQQCKTIWAAQ